MSTQHKCRFCGVIGHKITECDSETGKRLFDYTCSLAKSIIRLEETPIHERGELFYKYLIDILCADELKIILSKIKWRINGNKEQLAARAVRAFIMNDIDLQFSVKLNEVDHFEIYDKYWILLSQKLLIEANQELDRYLYLINQPVKFPICVMMKTVDLTEEEQPAQSFECAICMEEECPILDQVELDCEHSFCVTCVSTLLTNSQQKIEHPRCALCRDHFDTMLVHTQKIMEEYKKEYFEGRI